MFVFRGVQNRKFCPQRPGMDLPRPGKQMRSTHFTVEEYESNGKTQKRWTKIGAAFPHKEGIGFNIELKAFPVDGRLVVLPPDLEDSNSRKGK